MEEKDLKQIEEAFDKCFEKNFKPAFKEAFTESFTQVWEGNLEPAFDGLHERIDIIQAKLD